MPAKDVDAIYASYNMTNHDYVELNETESYRKVKNKWLILKSKKSLHGTNQANTESSRQADIA
ncbi:MULTISPECIES: hypothetical protein [Photobacterium]|uniref:Uncharacterized protein n=1 Tax=Photobacterium halotolerans TaxID=265726 RepID=A0A0F5VBN9_9GAMM|nr:MULTISPECIES: hypothetical protein [Photobacterium]KKC99512.1 hypothetical protein KY46_12765 [Photobacterium halotolerans]UIP30493.1 hypothetical protein LN341_17410 [Photobacterium sp. TLY01]